MPIHFDNVQHVGNKGITITRASCIPLTILTAPVISGVVEVGQTLTCTDGTYAGSTPYYIYNISWYNTSGLVQSGLSNSYVIQSSDVGQEIHVVVQAYNCAGIGVAVNNASLSTIPVPTPFAYLFDVFATYSVTPRAAYSFRKLNRSYTGACCRIRRSNDNAELDIGFVSNVVDVASIQAFVPIGASGQIVYIYDQSGNGRHRYQSVANRQPDVIDSAGVVKTQNGKVATHLNNASRMLQQATTILPESNNYSAFNVYNETNTGNNLLFLGGNNQYAYVSVFNQATTAFAFFSPSLNKVNNLSVTINTRGQSYNALTNKGSIIAHYADFNLNLGWGNANFAFGGYNNFGGGFEWLGYYMEEVYCDGSQVSNSALSSAVYGNQSSYFGLIQYDPDALAYINRVISAGGTLTYTEIQAVNQLVIDLKADGLWNEIVAAYPMIGSSAAAFSQNLKSSSYTANFSSGWTYASTGATPNGTSAYMDTTLVPNTALLSINDVHLSMYSRIQITASGGWDMGVDTNGASFNLSQFNSAVAVKMFMNGAYPSNAATSGSTDTTGLVAGTSLSPTERKVYQDGVLLTTNNNAQGSALPTASLYIGSGRQGISPFPAAYFSSRENAWTSIGFGLTDAQVSDLYTCVQAFQTTLGRQV